MQEWHNRLNEELRRKGITNLKAFARECDISYDSLFKYTLGKVNNPQKGALQKIAAGLDVEWLWLKEGVSIPGHGADKDIFLNWLALINREYPSSSPLEEKAMFAFRSAKLLFPDRNYELGYIRGLLEGIPKE